VGRQDSKNRKIKLNFIFFILLFRKKKLSIFRILVARLDNQYPCSFKKGPKSSILFKIS
jgi:hypothetical protein